MTKILDSKVEPSAKGPKNATETFSLISHEKLLAIYIAMVKCRTLQQCVALLFQQGQLVNDLHASAKHEASAAVVAVDLREDDTLFIAPGDWLPAFVKGLTMEGVIRALAPGHLRSDDIAAHELRQKNIVAPSGNALQTENVCELASKALTQRNGAIVVAIIADSPNWLKTWRKTISSAAARRLPIVFVHYADTSPGRAKHAKSRAEHPEAVVHGIPTVAVDAHDPVAVYRVAYEAIVRARQARGATIVECVTPLHQREQNSNPGILDAISSMEDYLKSKALEYEPHKRQALADFHRDFDLATRFLDR